MSESSIDKLCINTVRILASEMVEKSKSGHPGAPIGLAPTAHVLWTRHLNVNPINPNWPNRDRFILSNGHSCALQYTMLHLSGFDLTMDDIKQFRQLNSRTPGHPEIGMTSGIECTTGPLGQGIAQAVGMAIGSKHSGSIYNKPNFEIVNHKIIVICGDGCLQEGVSSEALSLAGHLKLDNLIIIYDDNKITIDGNTNLSFTEDVSMRLKSYGWNTLSIVDGNEDIEAIDNAITKARNMKGKPTFISCKTIIGYKTTKQNTHGVHGAPLGDESMKKFKKDLGFNPEESFNVKKEVYEFFSNSIASRGIKLENEWNNLFAEYKKHYPKLAEEYCRIFINKSLPDKWDSNLKDFTVEMKASATRKISGIVLNHIAPELTELIGGSADLTPSNNTLIKCTNDFQSNTPKGRYIRYGVREHGMFAIGNGLSAYGYIPFSATFLNFITYGWGAVRLCALSHLQHIFIMTHDSIFLGEDGPTHQPIEVLPLLRSTPNLLTMRPCDANEVCGAWKIAIENRRGPTVICLSRQNLPNMEVTNIDRVSFGVYRILGSTSSPIVLISSGSEVSLCVEVAQLFKEIEKDVSVLSAPCLELFDNQSTSYKSNLLPSEAIIVSIEAASTFGWGKYAKYQIGIDQFGKSGNLKDIKNVFGFTAEKIYKKIMSFI
jgi:transketolase